MGVRRKTWKQQPSPSYETPNQFHLTVFTCEYCGEQSHRVSVLSRTHRVPQSPAVGGQLGRVLLQPDARGQLQNHVA